MIVIARHGSPAIGDTAHVIPLARMLVGTWLEVRVVPVLLWSFTGVTLGTAIGWNAPGGASVGAYIGAVILGVLIQGLVAHTANDIVDWRSGTDADPSPRVLSGGSTVIPRGLIGPHGLRGLGIAAAGLAIAVGVALAWTRGWGLVVFGAVALAGSLMYSIRPLRTAYRPIAGEATAFICVWTAVAGSDALQRGGAPSGMAAVAGIAHGGTCVAMLMMHHLLDRDADRRARPPKRTSMVVLARSAGHYEAAWALVPVLAAGILAIRGNPAFWLMGALALLAVIPPILARPDDVRSTTLAELAVIGLGIAGGLGTAALIAPPLAWALIVPALLIPADLLLTHLVSRLAPVVRPG